MVETPERQPLTAAAPARVRGKASWLLNRAAVPANRLLVEALAGVGARRHDYVVLATLDEDGAASQAELSRRTTIDRSDMVAAINDLADRGFVERALDHTDRRRNVITLTPAGRRHLRKLDTRLGQVQEALLAPLTASERRQLVELLTRVVDHHATG